MLRARGNLTYSHKPSIDPIIGNELSKIARSVSNQTYGDQFPGRQATFGDMHFYTGEDTTSYKKNNWYIRTLDADANWQSMNATSIRPENIQTGTIMHGVKIADYLPLEGGVMGGKIVFVNEQQIPPEMLGPGTLPVNVVVTGFVPSTGGSYVGNIDMTDHSIMSINHLFGVTNLLSIDMSVDGFVVMGADQKISLIAPTLDLQGNVIGASGLISMWTDDVGYLTHEHDPIVGAVNGIVKADGAGNISAAVAGVDYLVDKDVDGGFSASVYAAGQSIDGGGA